MDAGQCFNPLLPPEGDPGNEQAQGNAQDRFQQAPGANQQVNDQHTGSGSTCTRGPSQRDEAGWKVPPAPPGSESGQQSAPSGQHGEQKPKLEKSRSEKSSGSFLLPAATQGSFRLCQELHGQAASVGVVF